MGWSCTDKAMKTMDVVSTLFSSDEGSNVFESGGKRYFYDTDGVEHDDGRITGEVYVFVGNGLSKARLAGRFEIAADGVIREFHGLTEEMRQLVESWPR